MEETCCRHQTAQPEPEGLWKLTRLPVPAASLGKLAGKAGPTTFPQWPWKSPPQGHQRFPHALGKRCRGLGVSHIPTTPTTVKARERMLASSRAREGMIEVLGMVGGAELVIRGRRLGGGGLFMGGGTPHSRRADGRTGGPALVRASSPRRVGPKDAVPAGGPQGVRTSATEARSLRGA